MAAVAAPDGRGRALAVTVNVAPVPGDTGTGLVALSTAPPRVSWKYHAFPMVPWAPWFAVTVPVTGNGFPELTAVPPRYIVAVLPVPVVTVHGNDAVQEGPRTWA